ncbi:MAG: hypothetical protein RR630_09220, partial [Coprobacillus sp.]
KELIEDAKKQGVEVNGLEKAVIDAQKVIDDETLTQEEVNKAAQKIRLELFKLYINVYISENENIDYSQYTDESVTK